MKILIKIPSKFGVEKCKNQTTADGPHDKREMPACAFRLVNTEVKPTSAFPEICTRIPVFIRLGCQIFNVFKVQNVAKNMTKTSFELTAEKRTKNEPKRTPKRDPHPLEIR